MKIVQLVAAHQHMYGLADDGSVWIRSMDEAKPNEQLGPWKLDSRPLQYSESEYAAHVKGLPV